MAMNGDKRRQIEVLKMKVNEWAHLVRTGGCSQELIWSTFRITISKQIEYVLLAHTFTEPECRQIMAPAIKIACQKSGYSSRLRLIFRQTSPDFFGAGAMDLFLQSGALKVTAIIMHSWKQSPSTNLLQMNIEAFVLEAGLYGNIWRHDNLKGRYGGVQHTHGSITQQLL